ncbi:MAG: DUF3160 domain-containing protein [Verrucomicrobiae bacterium]|nr:DUF3160 domain-containing protein [Verrucomicrobiae bacterium]
MATGVRLPKWTGTPAVKTFHLQQSSDLKNWASIGPAVTFEQVDPSLPLQFPLPPSDGTQFYRLNEKLTFRFEDSLTAESASFSAQFDGFLEEFEDLSIDGFRELYSPFAPTEFSTLVDPYLEDLTFDPTQAPFWKEFNTSPDDHNAHLPADDPERRLHDFRLNEGELSLFRKNGFVVSERLQRKTFVDMFYDIWTDDLPVFISSDAMLQAWHRTYVSMLEETEEVFLRPALQDMLDEMVTALVPIVEVHGDGPLRDCLIDVDLFVTMARSLIRTEPQQPLFEESTEKVREFFDHVKASDGLVRTDLFGEDGRLTDFTQFQVRGNYENSVTLARYFQTMIWLGRIDFRMGGGSHAEGSLRQLCDAAILSLLLEQSGQLDQWKAIEEMINAFVGFADFMTPEQMINVLEAEDMKSFEALETPGAPERLQARILSGHYGEQEIFSSLIQQGCPPTEPITLPRAFAFFGQKFVPDSWTLSKVTFDRIWKNGQAVVRRMPSGLDVAFATLGNDHVSDVLAQRMENESGVPFRDGYPYQHNLAAVRATLDSQEDAFWQTNMYQNWLGSLRALSGETRNPRFPDAMRSRAWAMKTVNTQLASWTQLRHDTILYVKQSVSPPIICEYPAGYVEPRLEFWERLASLAQVAHDAFESLSISGDGVVEAIRVTDSSFRNFPESWPEGQIPRNAILDLEDIAQGRFVSPIPIQQSECKVHALTHLDHFRTVAEKLGDVALTQLDRKPISEEQHSFIRSLVEAEEDVYLGIRLYSGWYPNLYYQNAFPGVAEHPSAVWDPLVTDVHTDAPDDCHGDDGGILHEAVGNVNFLLMAANHGDAQCVIGGPVFSHYEFILPIERGRMTDAEWKSNPSAPVSDFVKEFLVPAQP